MINLNSIQFAIWEKKLKNRKNQSFQSSFTQRSKPYLTQMGEKKKQKNESEIKNQFFLGTTKYSISSEIKTTFYYLQF